jgi:hypothetical protein
VPQRKRTKNQDSSANPEECSGQSSPGDINRGDLSLRREFGLPDG